LWDAVKDTFGGRFLLKRKTFLFKKNKKGQNVKIARKKKVSKSKIFAK